ncbi:hypothetical protein FA13DRAFT_1755181 [Coprinellus micaceus]|uniref:LIM zinc-binding domain-containing protein n=1 Tax=Coprinellus micaceus TaxID=71717 RepID=A0A4Y7TA44_COPMI|nr:hypothetical protein FA13DRAFT_1755181 [Coprinellus micaceus]
MFGPAPRCPRCERAVYAAEQIVGPGRKDSYTLLEHDEENFGTKNLRHANLPYAARPRSDSADDSASSSPPTSPPRVAPINTTDGIPRLRPNRVLSPTSSNFPRPGFARNSLTISPPVTPPEEPAEGDTSIDSSREEDGSVVSASTDPTSAEGDDDESKPEVSPGDRTKAPSIPTNTGRPGLGGIPRTVPLSYDHSSHVRPSTPPRHHNSGASLGSISETGAGSPGEGKGVDELPPDCVEEPQEGIEAPAPLLRSTLTGSRYTTPLSGGEAALSGGMGAQVTGSPTRKWGGSTPQCPRCAKSVYFAEQVKAVGKTYHKHCLRCTECGTTLDSTRLRDHDEEPFCVRCYNKLYGPQGGGYALLGKAGG